MNEEWLSAHLADELSPSQRRELESALAADAELAATYAGLAEVRGLLRAESVAVSDEDLARIVATVESTDTEVGSEMNAVRTAPVVALGRRRVPTFAAVAAALAIIAGVIGGLGGSTRIPALGDLVAEHQAAAAVIGGEPMPDDMPHMDKMPMEDAAAMSLPMPDDYAMADAFADGTRVHLVYRTSNGEPVSVIREEGEVDLKALGDGSMMSADGVEMWAAPMGDAYVAVVDGSGYFWTVISAEPHDDMMGAMMHDLPTRSPSLGERLRDAADAMVAPFRL